MGRRQAQLGHCIARAAVCRRLRCAVDQLGDDLAPETRARVIAASEGNPLFLEEMAALARERGTVAVPSTIQALLAARLEQLTTDERGLLERGAIEGEVFHVAAVRALSNEPRSSELQRPLAELVRKELIRSHPPTLEDDQAFRFRHLLIRDAAYDGLPKATRAELHERFADWLEHHAGGLPELDEIVGWHLEQTVRYQWELARAVAPALMRRAAEHLHLAGRRAGDRADVSAARSLLERAHALSSEGGAVRARIAVELAEQLIEGGDLARMDELLTAAERNPKTSAVAAVTRLEWLLATRPQEGIAAIAVELPAMLEQLHAPATNAASPRRTRSLSDVYGSSAARRAPVTKSGSLPSTQEMPAIRASACGHSAGT